jgi:ATP-binding cassette, subfamily B, bacterial CvaB/MchF/RaxB
VNEATRELNLTRIIVAHRPETIASADRVVLINKAGVQQISARVTALNAA